MPSPLEKARQDPDSMKAKILASARRLFAEYSYSGTTTRMIAKDVGIDPLTDHHWVVLDFVRKDADTEGEPPGVRRITKLTDVSMKEMYKLFPKGPGILASKLAGYGKPQGCV